jgi:phosphoribosylformylglycinamidine (FGAM) synthase PurS component
MPHANSDRVTGTIAIAVLPQSNGHYICQMFPTLNDSDRGEIQCYGQTQEHAIANALEQLANSYRQRVEEQQNLDWDAVERTEMGEAINKHYHVILHYERMAEEESKFEAMHNTIMGNTVVENAKISIIEIAPDLQVEPLARS